MNIYEVNLLNSDLGFDIKDQIEPVQIPKADICEPPLVNFSLRSN
jgi:hypothetical protein